MELILVGIGIIICIAVIISIVSSGNAERKRKEEAERKKRTGFSSFSFELKGSNYCSDLAKDLLRDIKEGTAVVLMPEFFNEYDRYAISVRLNGKHIGYMDRTNAYHWAEKLFDGCSNPKYHLCVASKVTLNEGFEYPLVEFEVFYREWDGEAKIDKNHPGPNFVYVNPIEGCGIDLVEDIAKRSCIVSKLSCEIIHTHPEYYQAIKEKVGDDEVLAKWKEEDEDALLDFIKELHCGNFTSLEHKKLFLKNVSKDRIYGNNTILKKLINEYLEFKELDMK